MAKDSIFAVTGIVLSVMACSVSDNASNWWIVLLGGAAMVSLFFSFKENRNFKRIRRLQLLVKRGHLPW